MSIRSIVLCAIAAPCLVACAAKPPKPPQPVETQTIVSAAADVNPDSTGRPSPVVVRLFQLRGDAEFNGADFFAIFDKEKETLGASLIMRDERVLLPGQQVELKLSLSPDARFLGAVAGYRDVRASHWRAIVEVPKQTPSKKPVERSITVRVDKDMINVSITH